MSTTQTPPTPTPVVNDATVQANQAQAAKLGVKIPGSTAIPVPQNSTQPNSISAPAGTPVKDTSVIGTPTSIDTLRQNSGTYKSDNGNSYYNYDSTLAPNSTTTNSSTSGTGLSSIGASATSQTTVPSTGNPEVDALRQQAQNNADALAATGKQVSDAILNIQNGVTPLTTAEQAQIQGLQSQFNQLIQDQQLQNTGATGTAQIRGYQTGAAEYDPLFQAKTIGTIVSAGAAKVADLQVKEAAAVAQMTQAFHDNDIKAIQSAWSTYDDAYKERQTTLQQTIKDSQAAIKDAQDAKIAADKVQYDEVTKPIQDIGLKAAELGATPDVLAKIKGATSVDEAITAAGDSIQSSTNPDIAQYLFYKQQATAAGTAPQSYEDYQKAQATLANQQAYSKAYATAKGSAEGAASAAGIDTSGTSTPTGLGGDSKGGGILNATGLSVAAFNFLTQGTASMSRMPTAQRNAIMNEAQNYLNRTGTDISTFQSQYKAYNEVVQNNIARANNTTIAANEISGTVDQFLSDIAPQDIAKSPFGGGNTPFASKGLSSLRASVILDMMIGKQVNDPIAQKYAFDVQTMGNDLAAYFAASRSVGASGTVPTPDDADKMAAASVISTGLNGGSAQAFKDSINKNEQKVTKVVNDAVTNAQKQVWGLFGAADKYASPVSATDTLVQQGQQTQSSVDQYVKQNPTQAQNISSLYTKGYTDAQVAEYLGLNP